MREEKLKSIRKFGKVGYIVLTIFLTILISVFTIATVLTFIFGKNLRMIKEANIKKDILIEVKADKNAVESLEKLAPYIKVGDSDDYQSDPDEDDYRIEEKEIEKTEDEYIFRLKGNNETRMYLSNLTKVLIASALAFIVTIINILLFRSIFRILRDGESPFSQDLVKSLKVFALSILPWTLLAGVFEYFTTGMIFQRPFRFSLDLNILIYVAIIYVIAKIFEYGVDLQTESDDIV